MVINKYLILLKLNGPTLRHEEGTSLRSNDEVCITRPHFHGRDNDLIILRKELKGKLDDVERTTADGMHAIEAPEKCFAPNSAQLLWRKKHC